MTLIPYDSRRLDELALRIFDMAAIYRNMAQRCRDAGIKTFEIHDKKAMEWLGKLEFWAQDSAQKFAMFEVQHRGLRRAKDVLE